MRRADPFAPSRGTDIGERRRRLVADHVTRKAGLFPGEVALEVATDGGLLAVAIAKAFTRCRAVGVGPWPKALEAARENAEREGVADRTDFVLAADGFLPFREEAFPFAVGALGWDALDDPLGLVEEIHRVTMYAGKVLLVGVHAGRERDLDEDVAEHMRDVGFGKVQRQKLDVLPGGGAVESLSAKRWDPEETGDRE